MICGVVATSISACGVCTACSVVCDHSLKYLLPPHRKSYKDVFLPINSTKNCSFNKAQNKLPEDGPSGPKHEGANIEIF
jgi:hypothetical protein